MDSSVHSPATIIQAVKDPQVLIAHTYNRVFLKLFEYNKIKCSQKEKKEEKEKEEAETNIL